MDKCDLKVGEVYVYNWGYGHYDLSSPSETGVCQITKIPMFGSVIYALRLGDSAVASRHGARLWDMRPDELVRPANDFEKKLFLLRTQVK